ncbi:MAG: cell division protein FtsA [Alistipes sp.]|nr:cell division protein FtsA [Alistipes sp.]
MKGKRIVAVDVGSTSVVMAIASVEEDGYINIEGVVSEPLTGGVYAGRIDNSDMVGKAINRAKQRLEKQLNVRITEAYAGMSGDYIRCGKVTDYVYVQDELRNGSNQLTQHDLDELDRRMNSVKLPDDRETIMSIKPLTYKIDEREVEVPVGAYGHVLTATYNFILCDKTMRDRLRLCLQNQGITVKEFVANTEIAHYAVATTEDMQEGAVIVDLGGGVTDVTVIANNKVRHIASIPIGMSAINEDIRSWGIPATYVENLKVQFGSAVAELADDDIIGFPPRKGIPKDVLRRNLVAIIEARLCEIIEWIAREIKEAGCGSKFNPSILITGGGSELRHIEELFKRELGYEDVRAVHPEYGITSESLYEHVTTPAYTTAMNILIHGAKQGSCSVAITPARVEEIRSATKSTKSTTIESEKVSRTPLTTEHSKQSIKPSDVKDEDEDNDETFGGEDLPPKRPHKLTSWVGGIFTKMKDQFTSTDDEETI